MRMSSPLVAYTYVRAASEVIASHVPPLLEPRPVLGDAARFPVFVYVCITIHNEVLWVVIDVAHTYEVVSDNTAYVAAINITFLCTICRASFPKHATIRKRHCRNKTYRDRAHTHIHVKRCVKDMWKGKNRLFTQGGVKRRALT